MDQEGVHRSAAEEVGKGDAQAGSRRARLSLVLGIAAVSFSSILSFLSGASPLAIAFYRNLLAGVILLPLAARSWGELRALTRRELLLLVLAGLFLSIHFGAWIASLFYTSITASVVLVHSDPLIVALLAFVFLGEKPSRRTMMGFVVALAGVVLITAEGGTMGAQTFGMGDLLALVGAFAVAVYFLLGRRLRQDMSVSTYASTVYLIAASFLFLGSLATSEPLIGYSSGQYLIFVALALGPSVLGHTSFNYALKYVKASTVSVATLGEPVVAGSLSVFIFNQTPTVGVVAGALLVLGGLFYALR
jgi:drug/metabolite transporter (DMT)-like permease